ncbi:hypothetical protein BY458DRAFT_557105 [Sporodiniella umbellata]|nr:hypothetical protein BY458DRAFT_557105 [Sporodiniella umbellata]
MSEESFNDSVYACARSDNSISFCSPQPGDVWANGTEHSFIWKKNNPFYVSHEYISIYLYYIINYAYVNVKTLENLPTDSGGVNVTVDDSWFIKPSSTAQNLTAYAYLLPSTFNATNELLDTNSLYPLPLNFTVTQSATPANRPFPSSTKSSLDPNATHDTNTNANSNNNSSGNSHNQLPAWAIAVIVLASIAILCGIAVLIWAIIFLFFRNKKKKQPPVVKDDKPAKVMLDTTSMNSQTPMATYRSTDSATARPVPPLDPIHSLSIKEEDEDPESHRRRLGEALLQKQLEEDGTFVKHAGRFTHVKSLADIQKSAVADHQS